MAVMDRGRIMRVFQGPAVTEDIILRTDALRFKTKRSARQDQPCRTLHVVQIRLSSGAGSS